ncbi:MAG: GNAT family protein [Actinomycetes bacterium]
MVRSSGSPALVRHGRRVTLRTMVPDDYDKWIEVRERCRDWLVPWEPRPDGAPVPAEDRASFGSRCSMRERERQMGTGYGFGVFVGDRLVGELTLSSVQRGPFQSAYIGYWIDEAVAGRGFTPEAVVVALRLAFEDLGLHRIEISIIPRNDRSKRVVEKLAIRHEGIAKRFLQINGVWEDHSRFAITAEEWIVRRDDLLDAWIED